MRYDRGRAKIAVFAEMETSPRASAKASSDQSDHTKATDRSSATAAVNASRPDTHRPMGGGADRQPAARQLLSLPPADRLRREVD
jgi:hypothetical protein